MANGFVAKSRDADCRSDQRGRKIGQNAAPKLGNKGGNVERDSEQREGDTKQPVGHPAIRKPDRASRAGASESQAQGRDPRASGRGAPLDAPAGVWPGGTHKKSQRAPLDAPAQADLDPQRMSEAASRLTPRRVLMIVSREIFLLRLSVKESLLQERENPKLKMNDRVEKGRAGGLFRISTNAGVM